jgi:hypothetical protein
MTPFTAAKLGAIHASHAFARPAVLLYEGWYRIRDAFGF